MLALICGIALAATLALFVRAEHANRRLPPAGKLPMKFGFDGELLQVESRRVALFLLPWLATVVTLLVDFILVLTAAPAGAAATLLGCVIFGLFVTQEFHLHRLRIHLQRRN